MDFDFNWFAVLFAALASFAIGWLWYSPLMFGPVWMKEVWGFDMKSSKPKPNDKQAAASANMGKFITLAFGFQLLSAFVLVHLLGMQWQHISEYANVYRVAAETALWLWLGFMVPLNFAGYLWEGRSLQHALINASQSLASLMASALILTALA